MESNKRYLVYILDENQFVDDPINRNCYIGYTSKTCEERIEDHFSEAKFSKSFTKKLNWLRNLTKENLVFDIIQENIESEQDALDLEVEYIRLAKEIGLTNNLKNGDDGGWGGTKNYTEEVIEKIRQSKIGNSWNKGKKHSEETRKKQSDSLIGRIHSEESLQKRIETRKINKIKNESTGNFGKWKTRKYTDEQIIEVFRLFNEEKLSAKEISDLLNIKKSTVSCFLYDKNCYKDVRFKYNLKVN